MPNSVQKRKDKNLRDSRRSSRIALSIPVEVSGVDASGAEIHESTNTTVVSRHGTYFFLQHRFVVGSEAVLTIPHLHREQRCRVVWIGAAFAENGPFETGVELDSAENFWGVQFPPEDWVVPKQVPLAGDQPGRTLPAHILGDHEQQVIMMGAMLNALIAVLEEKGIVTPGELAEMLKRTG